MTNRSKYISNEALFWLAIAASLLLFDALWRLIFLWKMSSSAGPVPGGILAEAFVIGARFDLVAIAYILLPLYVLSIVPGVELSRRRLHRVLSLGALFVVTGVMFFIQTVDLDFFDFFGQRLNGMALTWRNTPGMMVELAWDTYPVFSRLLLWAAMLTAFVLLALWLKRRLLLRRRRSSIVVNLLWVLPMLALLVLGGRGRVAVKTPIRSGVAYFSQYNFANQLALSPVYTFWRDAVYDARDSENQRRMVDAIDCPNSERITRELLGIPDSLADQRGGRIFHEVRFTPQNDAPPNVILIIMESFGSSRVGTLGSQWPYDITPRFDSLSEQGLLFTNFYSTGMHTFAGIFSSLTGLPHQFTDLIIKGLPGRNHFHGLADILRGHDYETIFLTAQDPHFDNLRGFLTSNGFEHMISELDFPRKQRVGMWGPHDHVMFDRAVEELRAIRKPFFGMMLSCSNHGRWLVPDVPFGRIEADVKQIEELNSLKYSDWALGRFVRVLYDDPAFANTIIVVTADNGIPYQTSLDLDLSVFQIPLLVLDTDRRLTPRRVERLGGQLDILATVMGLVRLDYDDYGFGHDLLDTASTGVDFAHMSEWYKIGYLEGGYYLIHRLEGIPRTFCRVDDPKANLSDSLSDLADRYEQRALALFRTGYYNQVKPLQLPDSSDSPIGHSGE